MIDSRDKLVTPEDERVLDALRTEQSLLTPAGIYLANSMLSSLVLEELRSYNRSWSHPLGFVLKS